MTANELVAMYLTKDRRVNPWFARKMQDVAPEIRDEVWRKIKELGLDDNRMSASLPVPRRQKVVFTDAEWSWIADKVFDGLRKRRSEPVHVLANKAISQMPKERHRRLTGHSIAHLTQIISKRIDDLLEAEKKSQVLSAKVESLEATSQSKEQIIASLKDREIEYHFKERILNLCTPAELLALLPNDFLIDQIPTNLLVAQAIARSLEMVNDVGQGIIGALEALKLEIHNQPIIVKHQKSSSKASSIGTVVLPKIALIGLLAAQFQTVVDRVGEKAKLVFVDKDDAHNADSIPNGCNYIVVWTKFVSHSIDGWAKSKAIGGTQLIRHNGGIDMLVKKLEEML